MSLSTRIFAMVLPGIAALFSPIAEAVTLLYFTDAHEMAPVDQGMRGGMARVAALVAAERATEEPLLVLFGGDLAGGTQFGLLQGEPIVKTLNAIGVDAANFGQHEFDHGVDQARRLVEKSAFPWVTANLTDPAGTSLFGLERYHVLEVDELRIGVFGITTAMDTTRHENRVVEQDAVVSARSAVESLQTAGADLIVALTQQQPEEDLSMVRQIPGVDLVLGEEVSETRSRIDHESGTYLARSAGNVSSLVRAQWLGPDSGDWRLSIIAVDSDSPEDPGVARLSDHYTAKLTEQLAAPVRAIEQPWRLARTGARSVETRLGHLLAQAYRHAMDSDIGFATAGGLRADFAAQPPAITMADIAAVLPFDNRLVRLRITRAELRKLLEHALKEHPSARNVFPLLDGLTVRFDSSAAPGARVQSMELGGEQVKPGDTLTLATTLFLADGGDGYTLLEDLEREAVGPTDREALANYLASRDSWSPTLPLDRSLIDIGEQQ